MHQKHKLLLNEQEVHKYLFFCVMIISKYEIYEYTKLNLRDLADAFRKAFSSVISILH